MKDGAKLDKTKFQELYLHSGSENYEVVELLSKNYQTEYLYLDSEVEQLIIKGYDEPINKKDYMSFALKLDILGSQLDSSNTNRILNNGVDWYREDYSNWPINGNINRHHYLEPLKESEKKDPEKWFEKFKELYSKASYVYIFMSRYYFMVADEWFMMINSAKIVDSKFKEQYPPKENQEVRMLELQDLSPKFHLPPEERETRLMKEMEYESAYFEEVNEGLNQYNYSAGWWYLEIYMPFDTIRIKRYSNYKRPELQLYKIPAAYGGRNDVLFIIQKPEKLFPEQVGGMYVIRPRDAQQPERRYKRISYGDTSKGQPHILRADETEEYIEWKAKQKG